MKKVIQIFLSILFYFISAHAQENQDTLSYENTYWKKVSINEDKTARSDSRSQAFNKSETVIQTSVDILNQFCMLNKPSPNKDIGCLKAFSNLNQLCEMREHKEFLRKFTHKTHQAVKKACLNWYDTQGRTENFFWLDRQACRTGFQSMNQMLLTLRDSKDMLTDGYFADRFEKSTCNEHRRYKNLCRYIDGDMKNITPTDLTKLPAIDYTTRSRMPHCKPDDENSMQAIEFAIAQNSKDPAVDPYKKIIADLKEQTKNKKDSRLPACESVRVSYYNLKCDYFEKFSEGETIYKSNKKSDEAGTQNPVGPTGR